MFGESLRLLCFPNQTYHARVMLKLLCWKYLTFSLLHARGIMRFDTRCDHFTTKTPKVQPLKTGNGGNQTCTIAKRCSIPLDGIPRFRSLSLSLCSRSRSSGKQPPPCAWPSAYVCTTAVHSSTSTEHYRRNTDFVHSNKRNAAESARMRRRQMSDISESRGAGCGIREYGNQECGNAGIWECGNVGIPNTTEHTWYICIVHTSISYR